MLHELVRYAEREELNPEPGFKAKACLPRGVLLLTGCRIGRPCPGRENSLRKVTHQTAHAGMVGQNPIACSRPTDGRCPEAEGARLLALHRFQA